MLDNFKICKIEVPQAQERTNGGDAVFKELRPGNFQNLRKTNTHRVKQLSKIQQDK